MNLNKYTKADLIDQLKSFKQIITKEPESIIEEESTPFYKDKKTYALLALLLLLGLGYYYRDELAPIPVDLVSKLKSYWNKPDNQSNSSGSDALRADSGNIATTLKSIPSNLINKIKGWWNKDKPDDQHSDTYNEVAMATIQEQDVWSDRAPSSVQSISVIGPEGSYNIYYNDDAVLTDSYLAKLNTTMNSIKA